MSIKNDTKNAILLTPAQCRAARGLVDWSQDDLAAATGGAVAKRTIVRFEKGETEPHNGTLSALRAALETAGAVFIPTDNNGGPGVRLR
jgi:transcriptional regulator with XRE-family HTH domain